MNIGCVNPPEKISARIQTGVNKIATKGRPASRIDTVGNKRAST